MNLKTVQVEDVRESPCTGLLLILNVAEIRPIEADKLLRQTGEPQETAREAERGRIIKARTEVDVQTNDRPSRDA